MNCVRKKYHRSEFAIYSEVTGISRHWVMNSKGTGYHFNFVMSQNGTSLQVWFNNPDEKKTESLYNKLRKLVNKERYLMVNKPFPCALENTHKYGIGISSGTALRMFDIIRKPVEGSKHSKKQIDLGSVFEVAKDEQKPVPRRKEKLFEEKKRDITQSTIKGFNREPNLPATNGDEPDVAEVDPKLAVKSC